MSIRLPDIVQRVVLDTRGFSMGKVGKELSSGATEADKFSKASDGAGKASRRAGKDHEQHATGIQRVNNAARAGAPSILRFADNLFKVRRGSADAGKAQSRLRSTIMGMVGSLKAALPGLILMGVKMAALGFAALAAIPAIAAMGGAAVALGGSLLGVLGVLPALSGGLLGLIGIGASLKVMFSGVKSAMKQQTQAAGASKAAAKSQRASAKAIESAQKAVLTAQKALIKARRDEAEAVEEVGETIYREQRKIADAQDAVTRADQTRAEALSRVRQAQDKVSKSYEEAAENLLDLARAAERADIAQRRAVQSERSAEQALLDALSSGDVNEIVDAQLNLESARLDTLDATDSLAESQEALVDAEEKGIENSDAVTEARAELAEATNEARDATREYERAQIDLLDAEREAVKAVEDAQQARVEAAERVVEAQQELADAYRGVAEARADAAEDASGGGASSNEEPPSKEATAIAKALLGAKKQLAPLKGLIQGITFQDIIAGIEGGTRVIGLFRGQLAGTAKLISTQFATLPSVIERSAPALQRVWDANNVLIGSANGLFNSFITGAIAMADAGKGVFDRLAGAADDTRQRIDDALANPETQGKMEAFFERAMDRFTTWWRILRDFSVGVINIFSAAAVAGDRSAAGMEKTAAAFREWTGDDKNRKKMEDFFERSRQLTSAIWGFIKEIGKGLGGIAAGPGIEALKGLFDRISGAATGGDTPLSGLITAFGNKALLSGIEAIHGVLDVLSGARGPETPIEKISVAFSKLGELVDPLNVFLDVFGWILDKISWAKDNIPGFTAILAGLAAVMAVKKVGKAFGLGGLLNGLVTAARFVIDQRQGVPAVYREVRRTADVLGAPVKESKSSIINRIRGIGKAGVEAGGDLDKARSDFVQFDNNAIGPLKERVKNCYQTAGRIEGIGFAALEAGDDLDQASPSFDRAGRELTDLDRSMDSLGSGAKLRELGSGAEGAATKMDQATPKVGKFRGALSGLAGGFSKASSGALTIGGAVWAAGGLLGDSEFADKLNKVGESMIILGSVSEITSLFTDFGKAAPAAAAGAEAVGAGSAAAGASAATGAGGFRAFASSMWLTTKAILASPITWIIVAIVALGAALYLLYKKNEGFRKFIDGLWQSIQRGWDKVLPVLKGFVSWIGDKALKALRAIWTVAKAVWSAIAEATVAAWNGVIFPLLQGVASFVTTYLVPAFQFLWSVIQTAFTVIGTVISFFWNTIAKPIFDLAVWTLTNIVVPAFNIFAAIIKDVFNAIGVVISLWWNYYAKPILSAGVWFIGNILIPAFNILWAIVKDVFNGVAAVISFVWNKIVKPIFAAIKWVIDNVLRPVFTAAWDTVSNVFGWIGDKIDTVWTDVISPVFKAIRDFVRDKLQPVFETLGDVVTGVWEAIAEAIPKAFDEAKKLLKTAVRGVGNIIEPILRGVATVADTVGMDNLAKSLRETAESTGSWGENAAGAKIVGRPGEHASGYRFPHAKRTEVGAGFKTGVPRAIVGEGSRHPEYVIPTDPKYRTRALTLLMGAAKDLRTGPKMGGSALDFARKPNGGQRPREMGLGGIVDGIKSAGGSLVGGFSAAFGSVIDAARGLGAYALESIWPKLDDKWVKDDWTGFPGNSLMSIRQGIIDAIRGKAVEDAEEWDAAKARDAAEKAQTTNPQKTRGLNPVFLKMFNDWNGSLGNPFSILSGWRDSAQQALLYQRYLAGTGNLAAPPGRSNHEKGLAIDVTPGTGWAPKYINSARAHGLHFPVRGEDWHVEPIDIAKVLRDSAYGPPSPPGKAAGGFLSNIPGLIDGGIVTAETLARIGEMGRPEAVVPLESAAGRRLLGNDEARPIRISVDARQATDPEAVRRAAKKGVEEALDELAELEEIGAE